ncbi:hypothetical protein GCM10027568_10530 [Humibacter soli]
MSTIGLQNTRRFAVERTVIRFGRALVAWGERRERLDAERRDLYRRQADVRDQQSARSAFARSQLLP